MFTSFIFAGETRATYEPPADKVLVFVGQDNASVGGNDRFKDGYVEHVGVPAGITHYIGIGNFSFEEGDIPGMEIESTWGAGPMSLVYYLDSPTLSSSVIHLSIDMVNDEEEIAAGKHDDQIVSIANLLKLYSHFPFIVRIGYEFEGEWNHYDSTAFKQSFRRVVDIFNHEGVKNYTTCMASASPTVSIELWEAYYTGDEYVDWLGYSYWALPEEAMPTLDFARQKGKPVFIAESTPRHHFFTNEDGKELWESWFSDYFNHIESNSDIIRAISYINCNWDAQPMWDNWGDTRLQVDDFLLKQWQQKMAEPRYINAADQPHAVVGFANRNGNDSGIKK